ncbi:hypothetical protein CO669_25090 [Bradyrhizobium sp. Y36]|uniref:hypothetical protein n=1 Tax=Bradyrhizobium sp. Y36 TaxID=2035447 RepID=UPI000BEA5515|nr:hypothetical protein [Bradyrhizobium sp. Y36]PDT87445.1 hypothetical protein CO669_25090 [Bradyrhizobium sp. Y36]
MAQQAAASANAPTRRPRIGLRIDLLGIAYLGTIGIVMLAWIAGLVWGAMAFFNWLVA